LGTYEIVAVLRPDLDEEGLGTTLDRISQRIAEHGGSVASLDRWGKRKLAYPIKKHRDGYYALFVFSLESGRIGSLRQTLGLHEDVLRFVFASHHPKPAPAPAASAQATPVPPPAAAQGAPATAAQGAPTATAPAPGASGPKAPPAPGAPHV